ncbi:protein phosphatase 2C domain-containing protein [uncultured Methanobacterium sp.]|uniref:protein phosphatase 2C domain-containing protein n=1 Tax=uncultured Methanobacterium sp. TaxID=176306 RepID=UPI002AA69DD7|nr:protein phosphatase 2C domain-containing protein [uncultured Methanobacterium sp.]
MEVGYKTDIGLNRAKNEDSFCIDVDLSLFIIADGMGGYNGGEIASSLAVKTVYNYLKEKSMFNYNNIRFYISNAIYKAHNIIKNHAKTDDRLKKMGTTLVLALYFSNKFYIANVGDSRAYVIKKEDIIQISEDQVLGKDLLKKGIISKKDFNDKFKHVITYALGKSNIEINYNEIKLDIGDYILLCTDGLTNMLMDEEIFRIIHRTKGNTQAKCDKLIKNAIEKGGSDNITLILVHNN